MKTFLKILIIAIVVAILNVCFSFLGSFNLVWIIGLALFAVDEENFAIWFGFAGGIFLDILMHGNVGSTSLVFGAAMLFSVLLKGISLGPKWVQSVLVIIVGSVVTIISSYILISLLNDVPVVTQHLLQLVFTRGFVQIVLSLIALGAISFWKMQNPTRAIVKI